jgi:phosphate transport system substrate-binding protein
MGGGGGGMTDTLSGEIVQTGSTTVLPIAEKWQDAFDDMHPGVKMSVAGGGSGNGIKDLIDGQCDIANASRKIKDKEIQAANDKGVNPVEHIVAYDGIAVVVHPSNPVSELSIQQVADMYTGKITNWSQVGGPSMDVVLIARDTASGTYGSFKELVIEEIYEDGDYADTTVNQASNDAVRGAVADTEGGIGYVGLGFLDSSVKAVGISHDGAPVMPSPETVKDGTYPVSRSLNMYTNGEPTDVVKEYLDWGKGPEGQKLVEEAGYVAII